MKKFVCLFLVIAIAINSSLLICNTVISKTFYNLSDCKNLGCDSNSCGAFVYGLDKYTMCSSALLPQSHSYNLKINGKPKSLCQSGRYLYCLSEIDAKKRNYRITTLNCFDGTYKETDFYNMGDIYTDSFSVSNSKLFIIKSDSTYAYVCQYSFNGKFEKKYSFEQNVNYVFNNNQNTYVSLYDGSIYKLFENKLTYCAKINENSKPINAGINYVSSNNGVLVCLENGKSYNIDNAENKTAVVAENYIRYYDNGLCEKSVSNSKIQTYNISCGIKYITAYKNSTAIFTNACECIVVNDSEFLDEKHNDVTVNDNSSLVNFKISNNIIYGIKSGTKVTSLISQDCKISSNGKNVTSGIVKTGYTVIYKNKKYVLSVIGDVTGEGNVKSNDVSAIIKQRIGETSLSGTYKKSADYNLDGKIDNKDIILVMKKSNQ